MIRRATPADLDQVRELFKEYAASLSVDLCFQNFQHELATLPGTYDPILVDDTPTGSGLAGCIALRPLTGKTAEMKRLYVRPEHRGTGLGRKLVEAIIEEAKKKGYTALRLDTLPEMQTAIAMYHRMGFQQIPPYTNNPVPGALFMELTVTTPGRITGVGGVFIKSKDHKSLRAWYKDKLGVEEGQQIGQTAWSIFPADSTYFPQPAMVNYTVDNLDAFLAKCQAAGIQIDPKRESADYGHFAWIYDAEGNKIELWQPAE